jgi:hypothetical protein
MSHRPVKVIKSDRVVEQGSICLEIGEITISSAESSSQPAFAGVAQEAKIIESNSEYAIIEVICSCGSRSHIQCNYAAVTAQE